ncbi:helix-turn-helix domain-containing protein [Streptomyces bathyalis]|uniref:Helix-turn-helix domain-containing protein n=1 Tax=Streptomyces bathyalis TaxID=2710756 RepID=A0A7T1T926_9ACTN|nr:helix-turn-helix domain-containing protein [Streptomyces bathyalis]QPP08631.1 helix-turn-helix domain-containing protein [Streptomyces bathyalis]
MTAETSQTLDRGLRVLKLLADTDHGLTVTELSNKLGVNRTVVYRLLATLEQHALVRRDLGGRARVGLGVLRLGRQVHPLVREAALPALRSLAEEIGATAHLTLVDGTEALAVAVVEPSWTDYHVAYRTGFRHPLDKGAAGRAILAGRGPDSELGPGFVLTHGELEAGAGGAAAPVRGVTGIEGSVGVVMLTDAVPPQVGERVVRAAQEVADALR